MATKERVITKAAFFEHQKSKIEGTTRPKDMKRKQHDKLKRTSMNQIHASGALSAGKRIN